VHVQGSSRWTLASFSSDANAEARGLQMPMCCCCFVLLEHECSHSTQNHSARARGVLEERLGTLSGVNGDWRELTHAVQISLIPTTMEDEHAPHEL